MSVETGGPVTGGLLLPKEKEREELMHGGKIYWGLISFRDSHSRDEEVKRFIAERMILLDDKLRSQAETICALLKEAERKMDGSGLERWARQYIASAMSCAGREGAVPIPYHTMVTWMD